MIGASSPRDDVGPKSPASAHYPADMQRDDVLHARVVFTDQPHARLLRLDTAAAEAVPGVVAVLTAADVPVNEYGLTMFDQPVLIGTESTRRSAIPCDISRWEADHLALVVAETHAAAAPIWPPVHRVRMGATLPIIADIDAALRNEVILRPEIQATRTSTGHTTRPAVTSMRRSARPMSSSSRSYDVPYQEHAYLQPEAAVAISTATAESPSRSPASGPTRIRSRSRTRSICHATGFGSSIPAIGGAFGGREDMSLQIVHRAGRVRLGERGEHRPIRCQWSREESIVGHHKRHRGRIRPTWGAMRDGRVVAARGRRVARCRAVQLHVQQGAREPAHVGLRTLRDSEHPRRQPRRVHQRRTGGAFRGFGAPQGAFAAECQMNKLADALGLDPVEIRRDQRLPRGFHRPHRNGHARRRQFADRDRSVRDGRSLGQPVGRGRSVQRARFAAGRAGRDSDAAEGSPPPTRTSASPSAFPNAARPGSC